MIPKRYNFRAFSTTKNNLKELPRPSKQYLSDIGEQPIPLSEDDIASKEVSDIELPQATLDEKAQIKAAMKKRSLRMTFWQLFLLTILGSSTLNIMREKNTREELEENFDKKFNVLKKLINEANEGKITIEEAREALKTWNQRFVDVFELEPIEISGVEGLNKDKLKEAFSKIKNVKFDEKIDDLKQEDSAKPKEQLSKFL